MSSTFRSLKYYNARLFFSGLAVSNVGTWLQMTAMSLLVYRLTGEATAVGITLALQMLPTLLLGAWAGVIADGRDRRTMAIVTQSALGRAGADARHDRPRRLGERCRWSTRCRWCSASSTRSTTRRGAVW